MKFVQKLKLQIICGCFWIILGICACMIAFGDSLTLGLSRSYCAGTGGGLIAVGFLQGIRALRLLRNESLRQQAEIRFLDERNVFIQKQIYSLHSLFSLVLLYTATLWAAIVQPSLLLPFLLLMLLDVLLLFLAAIYCKWKNA